MDLSKLPKLSQTGARDSDSQTTGNSSNDSSSPKPESPQPGVAPIAVPVGYAIPRAGMQGLAEGWISLALGLILLFLFNHTLLYLHSPATFEQNFPVNDAQGNPLPYTHSVFFWTDLGVTVFAIVLIFEGFVLAWARKRAMLAVAIFVTLFAGLFNLGVVFYAYDIIGFQIVCAIAVAVCGYMAMTQWMVLQASKSR